MIKYVYFILSAIIVVTLIEGAPLIDIFSSSWHLIARWSLIITAFLSIFGTIIVLLGYAEEHDNPQCDFAMFFLRTTVGLKFLPKWPVMIWLVLAAVLVQFNQLGIGFAVGILVAFASSVVFVHNGLYRTFLMSEAKGESNEDESA